MVTKVDKVEVVSEIALHMIYKENLPDIILRKRNLNPRMTKDGYTR